MLTETGDAGSSPHVARCFFFFSDVHCLGILSCNRNTGYGALYIYLISFIYMYIYLRRIFKFVTSFHRLTVFRRKSRKVIIAYRLIDERLLVEIVYEDSFLNQRIYEIYCSRAPLSVYYLDYLCLCISIYIFFAGIPRQL